MTPNSSMGKSARVLLAGATGLVGGAVLARRVASAGATATLLRRDLPMALPQVESILLAADPWDEDAQRALATALDAFRPTVYISALGTTLRRAGSREAFRRVDFELNLLLARAARASGASHCVLVSSIGADPRSSNFYLRVKGELESAIESLGFERVDFLQPGLLLGSRGEPRAAEALGQRLSSLYNPLLIGSARRYRAIPADTVAAAIVGLLAESAPGVFRHRFDGITALAKPRVQ